MRPCSALALAFALGWPASLAAHPLDRATGAARALPEDGVYGRFEGDLTWTLGAGIERWDGASRAALSGSLAAFSMAGLRVDYARAPGDAARARDVLAAGVELAPLFIPRWVLALEGRSGFGDLVLDSLTLDVGAWFARPRAGGLGDRRGLALGLGLGLPLFAESAGLWLDGRAWWRVEDARGPDGGGGDVGGLVVLAWHGFALSPWAAADEASGREPP